MAMQCSADHFERLLSDGIAPKALHIDDGCSEIFVLIKQIKDTTARKKELDCAIMPFVVLRARKSDVLVRGSENNSRMVKSTAI
jgi:hypothetical protein